MLLTTRIMSLFGMKMKGPLSHRIAVKQGRAEKQKIIQDFFSQYYTNTVELYKNNFTAQQLANSSQSIKRVFSLANSTPSQLLKYRIGQAVKKYQNSFKDHGSAGVQCAAMSQKVILQMMHVKKYPRDKKAGRFLTKLIQKRRNMLNYLMKTDYHKYQWVCTDYGIPQVHPKNAHHIRDQGIRQNSYRVYF